jgi:serine/threonine-protein kinase
MELLEGETLAQRLKRLKRLNPPEVARVVSHIARAISRAHEAGIVHRDLKPENVFIVHNEDEEIAKVLDFGVAKVERGQLAVEGERTRTGSILGTPYYMSPEQAQGNKAIDTRSDLWSLGVIAFECVTGARPFYSDGLGDLVLQICVRDLPVPSQVASVPLGFDEWFKKAIERDPDARFQSAREMSDALREVFGLTRDVSGGMTPQIAVTSRPDEDEAGFRADSGSSPSRFTTSSVNERAEMPTLAGDSLRESAAADPTAATLAYTPGQVDSELRRSREVPAADTSSGSGLGAVVAVAGLFLAIGLGGGVYAIQHYGLTSRIPGLGPDRARTPPTEPLVESPSRVEGVPAPKPSAAGERAPAPVPSSSASSRAATAPSASVAPREKREEAEPFDAGIMGSRAADGGYVKPDWAIPDPEPQHPNDIDEVPAR